MEKVETHEPEAVIHLSTVRLPVKPSGPKVPGDVRASIESITWQARAQWAGARPMENPAVAFELHLRDLRRDPDEIVCTIQDALCDAGVIKGGLSEKHRGPQIKLPVVHIGSRALLEEAHVYLWRDWVSFALWMQANSERLKGVVRAK